MPEVEDFLKKNPVKIKGYGLPQEFHDQFSQESTSPKKFIVDYKSPKNLQAHLDRLAFKGHIQQRRKADNLMSEL
jgi:hypothetical protein